MSRKGRIYRTSHSDPGDLSLGFIILPYGEFYKKTAVFLEARRGDIIRFYNGPEFEIERVVIVDGDEMCDSLCMIRYGVPWGVVLSRWLSYALMEGNSKDILYRSKCLMVIYKKMEG